MTTYSDYKELLLDAGLIYYPEEAAEVAHAERWFRERDILDADGNPVDIEIVLDAREIALTIGVPAVVHASGEITVDW